MPEKQDAQMLAIAKAVRRQDERMLAVAKSVKEQQMTQMQIIDHLQGIQRSLEMMQLGFPHFAKQDQLQSIALMTNGQIDGVKRRIQSISSDLDETREEALKKPEITADEDGNLLYRPTPDDQWETVVKRDDLRGARGMTGPVGRQGDKGDKGAPGEVGPQGPQGEQGPQGVQGIQGVPGEPFQIKKLYASVPEMEADTSGDVQTGEFVMISSNVEDPDNSKLYVKTDSGFNFITDLSGAAGIQGPQGAQGVQGEQGIQGPKGDTGSSGVEIGATEPTDPNITVWVKEEENGSLVLYIKDQATGEFVQATSLNTMATQVYMADGSTVETAMNGKASGDHTHTLDGLDGVLSISKGGTGADTAGGALINLGISATADEINLIDGATSNIQTQIDGKAASNHTHTLLTGITDAAKHIPLLGGGKPYIPANANINTEEYLNCGSYSMTSANNPATVTGLPIAATGNLIVASGMGYDSEWVSGGKWQYRTRTYVCYNGVVYMQKVESNGSGTITYGKWMMVTSAGVTNFMKTFTGTNALLDFSSDMANAGITSNIIAQIPYFGNISSSNNFSGNLRVDGVGKVYAYATVSQTYEVYLTVITDYRWVN